MTTTDLDRYLTSRRHEIVLPRDLFESVAATCRAPLALAAVLARVDRDGLAFDLYDHYVLPRRAALGG